MKVMMNSVNMTSLGERHIPAPTPKMGLYPEGYFMRKSPLAKDYVRPEHPVKKCFKNILKIFKK